MAPILRCSPAHGSVILRHDRRLASNVTVRWMRHRTRQLKSVGTVVPFVNSADRPRPVDVRGAVPDDPIVNGLVGGRLAAVQLSSLGEQDRPCADGGHQLDPRSLPVDPIDQGLVLVSVRVPSPSGMRTMSKGGVASIVASGTTRAPPPFPAGTGSASRRERPPGKASVRCHRLLARETGGADRLAGAEHVHHLEPGEE